MLSRPNRLASRQTCWGNRQRMPGARALSLIFCACVLSPGPLDIFLIIFDQLCIFFHSDRMFRPQAPLPTTTHTNSRWLHASKSSASPRGLVHTLTRHVNRYAQRRAPRNALTAMHLSSGTLLFSTVLYDSHTHSQQAKTPPVLNTKPMQQ